jgi:hypothetical protein
VNEYEHDVPGSFAEPYDIDEPWQTQRFMRIFRGLKDARPRSPLLRVARWTLIVLLLSPFFVAGILIVVSTVR